MPFVFSLKNICRVIHEERSIFWEVILSFFVRKKMLYEHVYTSEWLPVQTCLNIEIHCILIVMYALFCIFRFHRANWHSSATLNEVFL